MSQEQMESILANMAKWSNGKYTARISGRVPNLILVEAKARTRNEAHDMVEEMQHIVATHYTA